MKKTKRPSKKILIIAIASLVLLLAAGVYTWQSLAAWKGYEARLLNEQRQYQQLKDTALNGKSASERLGAIRSLDDKLADGGELCKMNGLFAWQASIIPPLHDGVKACEAKVKQLSLVAAPLSSLRDSLDTAEKLQAAVVKLAPTEAFTDKNWAEKGLGNAKAVQKELGNLKVGGDAKELTDKASTLSDNLVKAWEELIKANEAKNKDGFLAASAAVVKAYADFASLADESDSLIQPQVQEVIDEASKL